MQTSKVKNLNAINVKQSRLLTFRVVEGVGDDLTLVVESEPTERVQALSTRALITAALRGKSHQAGRFINRLALEPDLYDDDALLVGVHDAWNYHTGVDLHIVRSTHRQELLNLAASPSKEFEPFNCVGCGWQVTKASDQVGNICWNCDNEGVLVGEPSVIYPAGL